MEDTITTELLFATGVLTKQSGKVTTTDRFECVVENYIGEITALSQEELSKLIRERVPREVLIEPFIDLGSEDYRTIAELCTLHDHLDPTCKGTKTLSDNWLSLLPVLRLFRAAETPIDGVPESFIPIPATHIPHLTRIYSPAIVYIWLDKCPPCDTTKKDLESIFKDRHEVMPFAVYGPDYQEFLLNEYEVTAGPALLFMCNGTVNSRLYGSQGSRAIKAELAKAKG